MAFKLCQKITFNFPNKFTIKIAKLRYIERLPDIPNQVMTPKFDKKDLKKLSS